VSIESNKNCAVDDLEQRQREMRERMRREVKSKSTRKSRGVEADQKRTDTGVTDVSGLRKRIAMLEAENADLRAENDRLREQKTVYVERKKVC